MRWRRRAALVAVMVMSGALAPGSSHGPPGLLGAPSAGAAPTAFVRYAMPVDGPVVDPFRPPEHIGARGNRGIEYGNPLWAPVVASADGRVTFAGQVFGNGTVVIEHPDGVRTTYGGLTELWIGAGQTVRQLDGIGMAGTNVHFGALRRNTYLDPQVLIDASSATGRTRLVPVAGEP